MNRKLNKLLVTILTILVVTLIAIYLRKRIDAYFSNGRSYQSVGVGMALMVAVYYPMTKLMTKYLGPISKSYLSGSKKLAKTNRTGVIIGFLMAIFVLFIFYAKVWYNLDVLKDLLKIFK